MKSLLSFLLMLFVLAVPSVFAQDGSGADSFMSLGKAIGAGFAMGVAALGGALGQGNATASAVEGISRNPGATGKIFTPFILGLALIESLVIYALVVAFLLLP